MALGKEEPDCSFYRGKHRRSSSDLTLESISDMSYAWLSLGINHLRLLHLTAAFKAHAAQLQRRIASLYGCIAFLSPHPKLFTSLEVMLRPSDGQRITCAQSQPRAETACDHSSAECICSTIYIVSLARPEPLYAPSRSCRGCLSARAIRRPRPVSPKQR